ncbi:MAG: hypothetical protein KGJ06_07880 [Pseudomonadota bacterium]|nr:hypothetical protein [Pseudomonadota bacterium]
MTKRLAVLVVFLLAWPFSASAQQSQSLQQTAQDESFPQLPPSSPCRQADIVGIWSLVHVYESPSGSEAAAAVSSPSQYMLFDANNTFGKYNAGNTPLPPDQVRAQILSHASGVQQYVVQDKTGFIFFYDNSVAFDTQACFIVANPVDAFYEGEMLLMPPEGQIKERLVKVYAKIWPPKPKPQPQAQPRPQPYMMPRQR